MSSADDRRRVIVLRHGWAMQDWFWDPLREALGENEYVSMSPTYFAETTPEFQIPDRPWVGIGHSQGLQKLTEVDLSGCRGLVSVSGFWDFCGDGGTPNRIVQRMIRRFGQDPMEVLRSFYRNCGLDFEPPAELDHQALHRDLEQLLDSVETKPEEKAECAGVPIFAIAGAQDKIVPSELAKNQFSNLTLHPTAGHSLGHDESNWCAEQIGRFLNSI